jgi:hypothetical protein
MAAEAGVRAFFMPGRLLMPLTGFEPVLLAEIPSRGLAAHLLRHTRCPTQEAPGKIQIRLVLGYLTSAIVNRQALP